MGGGGGGSVLREAVRFCEVVMLLQEGREVEGTEVTYE